MAKGVALSSERFEFGRNWQDFIEKHFGQERVDTSKQHLLEFLDADDLKGKTFLDIGCGSGLHSLAAFQAEATQITSFDYDPNSVNSTEVLKHYAGNPAHWSLSQGSVLDAGFMSTLEPADIVYSWGVLHHTGNVWQAVKNAAGRVKPGGQFYIALYSADVQINPSPEFWLELKQRYIASSVLGKRMIELWYIWRFSLNKRIWNLPGLIKHINGYKSTRGMSYYTDVKDWVGGWPMEFCWDADVTSRVEAMGFKQIKIATGHANTEFLFVRES